MLRNENMNWKIKLMMVLRAGKFIPKASFFLFSCIPSPLSPARSVCRSLQWVNLVACVVVCLWLRVWRMNDFIKIDCIILSFCFVFSSPFSSLHHFFRNKVFFHLHLYHSALLCPVHNQPITQPRSQSAQSNQIKCILWCTTAVVSIYVYKWWQSVWHGMACYGMRLAILCSKKNELIAAMLRLLGM